MPWRHGSACVYSSLSVTSRWKCDCQICVMPHADSHLFLFIHTHGAFESIFASNCALRNPNVWVFFICALWHCGTSSTAHKFVYVGLQQCLLEPVKHLCMLSVHATMSHQHMLLLACWLAKTGRRTRTQRCLGLYIPDPRGRAMFIVWMNKSMNIVTACHSQSAQPAQSPPIINDSIDISSSCFIFCLLACSWAQSATTFWYHTQVEPYTMMTAWLTLWWRCICAMQVTSHMQTIE